MTVHHCFNKVPVTFKVNAVNRTLLRTVNSLRSLETIHLRRCSCRALYWGKNEFEFILEALGTALLGINPYHQNT